MFFTFGRAGGGGGLRGVSPKGLVHNLLMLFFTLDSSKMENFETDFCDTIITCNDHPKYVKHVLRVFHRIWVLGARGGGGGSSQGMGTKLAYMQFFNLGSSKIKVFESSVSDAVLT